MQLCAEAYQRTCSLSHAVRHMAQRLQQGCAAGVLRPDRLLDETFLSPARGWDEARFLLSPLPDDTAGTSGTARAS